MKNVLVLFLIVLVSSGARGQMTYYSASSAVDFSILSNWGTNHDGTGANPASITGSDDYVVANNAMISTLGGNVTIGNLTIESGSSLTLDGTNTLTASGGLVTVGGELVNTGSVASQLSCVDLTISGGGTVTNATTLGSGSPISVSGTFAINDGGTYIHSTGRSADIGATKSFASSSNFEYQQGVAFSTSLPYGNLRWNGTGSATPNKSGIWSIRGTLRVSAGTLNLQSTKTGGINIGGGLLIDGGTLVCSTGDGVPTVSIDGDVDIESGTLTANGATSTAAAVIDVLGNWHNASAFDAGYSTVTFKGASPQAFSGTGTGSFNNLTINSEAGLTVNDNMTVNGTLTMTSGDVNTNDHTFVLGSTSEGTLSHTNGTVIGYFARYVSGTNGMLFPVGTSSNYHPLTITYTVAPTTAGTITVSNIVPDLNGNNLPVALTDGSVSITRRSDQYWKVTHLAIDGGTYDISVDGDGQNGVGDASNLRIVHSGDGSTFELTGYHSAGSSPATANRNSIDGSVEGLFYLGGFLPDDPLPVTICGVAATTQSGSVHLTFSTASEVDLAGFDILRSTSPDGPFEIVSSYKSNTSLRASGSASDGGSYAFIDSKVVSGRTYFYKIHAVDQSGATEQMGEILTVKVAAPEDFALYQNFPNPFNPTTAIGYRLSVGSHVTLRVYNILGREVATLVNSRQSSGFHNVIFEGARHASGMYFYKIDALGDDGRAFTSVKSLMLVR